MDREAWRAACDSWGHKELDQRRQWHPSPVLLLGKSHGWRSLVGCSPWVRLESDTTERLNKTRTFGFSHAGCLLQALSRMPVGCRVSVDSSTILFAAHLSSPPSRCVAESYCRSSPSPGVLTRPASPPQPVVEPGFTPAWCGRHPCLQMGAV